MRLLIIPVLAILLCWSFSACNSSSKGQTFCDTTCNNDSIIYRDASPAAPFVKIGMKGCRPDSINWGHSFLANSRIMAFSDLIEKTAQINKTYMRSVFKDTSYAWLIFNECINGQGFVIKLTFGKDEAIFRKNSAFNSFDPKFSIPENLVAYTDRGNIFVEDMQTGKKASMTFGKKTDLDYNAMHETIDSVNVTPTRVWVKIKIDDKWTELEKNITLE